MKARAAVLFKSKAPLEVVEIDINSLDEAA